LDGYELVLQFRGPKVETEDEIVEIEDALFEVLEHGESWTGHDVSTAARNIVVETPDAQATFARIAAFLTRAGLIDDVVVGVRALAGTTFVTLWPPGGEPFDAK
jgi:hypothetical protein